MNNIRSWYLRNQVQITWFIIGWLVLSLITSLSYGDYVNAAISAVIIALNLALNK